MVASGVCHTDAYTLSGAVVVELAEGVTSLAVGDHVIPLYSPECRQCRFVASFIDHHLRHHARASGSYCDGGSAP